MTLPRSFDSYALSHRVANKLCETLRLDEYAIKYRARRAQTQPGVMIAVQPRTRCYIIDLGDGVIDWRITADIGDATTGSCVVSVASGTINMEQTSIDDAALVLAARIEDAEH